MRRIKLTEATDDQLRTFAETVKVIDTSPCRTRADILAVLGPAMGEEDEIVVEDSHPAVALQSDAARPDVPTMPRIYGGLDYGPHVILKIGQTDMVGGKHPAYPNVNGYKIVIQRGVLVGVPYAHYEAMVNAVQGSLTQDTSDDAKIGQMVSTELSNYPLMSVMLPPQHEIDEWRKATGARELGSKAPLKIAA